jgi:hypothetical protein
MSTAAQQPDSPAKRVLRSETILAAKLVHWLALCNSLAAQIDQLPSHLQELFQQLHTLLAPAQALCDHLVSLREDTQAALGQRNALMAECDELFRRLRFGLEAVHGPRSARLHEYGFKPQARPGRRKKIQLASADADVQGVEATLLVPEQGR